MHKVHTVAFLVILFKESLHTFSSLIWAVNEECFEVIEIEWCWWENVKWVLFFLLWCLIFIMSSFFLYWSSSLNFFFLCSN